MLRTVLLFLCLASSVLAGKSVTVFVALCDNKTQGIVPVGERIGNGDDPPNNLYWGCSDGMKSYFKNSAKWSLVKSTKPEAGHVLERCDFVHMATGTKLTAFAYRGSEMKRCLEDYFRALGEGGGDDLMAFIGHNGLMDTKPVLPEPPGDGDAATSAVVLCCVSASYFADRLEAFHARPLLLTRQLMYPGSFLLHDSIEVWLKGGSRRDHREAAARAYARNQKIPLRAARGVFAELE